MEETKYNRAKWWQLLLFVFNNTASNIYLISMNFVSYYANGVVGLAVVFVSNVIMISRLWDGITDPIIGYVVDKTNGKFGKFRPFMLLGNLIMFVCMLLMYHTTHLMPENFRGVYWILIYMVYIIGYTFQNSATRGGQTVLTNDPGQRPMFARIDGILNAVLQVGLLWFITGFLVNKYGGFSADLFSNVILVLGPISLILTILAIFGIWEKDQPENYEALGDQASYGFKDIFRIIKGNRAIQMLVISASTDKLASNIRSNASVGIMLYAIIIGDYSLLSKMSMFMLVPVIVLMVVGTSIAARRSSKRAVVVFTWISLGLAVMQGLLLLFGDPTQISFENVGFMTISFVLLQTLISCTSAVTGNIVTPMIADCADYELYQSGSYAPALMGTVFGFFDKVVSSLASTIVGYSVALIGFREQLPRITDEYTPAILGVTLVLYIGAPILGWVATLVAMRFYPLNRQKMIEVQDKIAEIKSRSVVNVRT